MENIMFYFFTPPQHISQYILPKNHDNIVTSLDTMKILIVRLVEYIGGQETPDIVSQQYSVYIKYLDT